MSLPRDAAVIGLGLIGGSIARDLAAAGVRVAGWDANDASVDAARRSGIIAEALDASLAGVAAADLVVIAVPVDAAPGVLRAIAPHLSATAVVTDTGSTKARIVAAARDAGLASRFVGSHPLAGDHRSGWNASRAGLFHDARVYLCAPSDAERSSIERVAELWHGLGATTVVIDADAHDRRLAYTSHLPQLVASALALVLAGQGIARDELGPGGRDMTRLAGSSPEMWAAIAHENASEIAAALAAAEVELAAVRRAVAAGHGEAIGERLGAAARWHAAGRV